MKKLLKETMGYQWANNFDKPDDKTTQANYMLDVTRYVFCVHFKEKYEKTTPSNNQKLE